MLAPAALDKNVFYFRVAELPEYRPDDLAAVDGQPVDSGGKHHEGVNVLSVVGVFGVAGRCIDEPYDSIVIVDDVTYAAATCHLIFPLL
jgi:hypothetical protein